MSDFPNGPSIQCQICGQWDGCCEHTSPTLEPPTTNDGWLKERATHIVGSSKSTMLKCAIIAFGQEAIERGKADMIHPDEVVVLRAELNKLFAAKAAIARLENPDEALVEAVCEAMEMCDNPYCSETLGRTAIAALARTLEGKEGA